MHLHSLKIDFHIIHFIPSTSQIKIMREKIRRDNLAPMNTLVPMWLKTTMEIHLNAQRLFQILLLWEANQKRIKRRRAPKMTRKINKGKKEKIISKVSLFFIYSFLLRKDIYLCFIHYLFFQHWTLLPQKVVQLKSIMNWSKLILLLMTSVMMVRFLFLFLILINVFFLIMKRHIFFLFFSFLFFLEFINRTPPKPQRRNAQILHLPEESQSYAAPNIRGTLPFIPRNLNLSPDQCKALKINVMRTEVLQSRGNYNFKFNIILLIIIFYILRLYFLCWNPLSWIIKN